MQGAISPGATVSMIGFGAGASASALGANTNTSNVHFPSSPVGATLRSPRDRVGRTNGRLSTDFNNIWESERPSWGSMGNLPHFAPSLAAEEDSQGRFGAMPLDSGSNVSTLSYLGTGMTSGVVSGSGAMSHGGARTGSGVLSPSSTRHASPFSPSASASPFSQSTATAGLPQPTTFSPNNFASATQSSNNNTPTAADYEYYARGPSALGGPSNLDRSPFAGSNAAVGSGKLQSSNGAIGSGTASPSAPMMKPAPLQRAGSAGGVLMHAPRRPPPSNASSGITTTTAAAMGIQPQAQPSLHSQSPIMSQNHTQSIPQGMVQGHEHSAHHWSPAHLASHHISSPSSPHFSSHGHYEHNDASLNTNEEWFDQFGGMEMEAAQPNNVAVSPYDVGSPSMASNANESHIEMSSMRMEMSSRMMGARYLPNQRATFGAPRVALYSAVESSSHQQNNVVPGAPTYLAHTGMPMGMSSPSTTPAQSNSPLTGAHGSPSSTYSPIKHSSRILMLHNFDQLGVDVNTIRAWFAAQGGLIRSISPFPESNALLVSFFDLRHAQKAMLNLGGKALSNGAILELQYHFLRDSGSALSKDANQGTLVIFNLDPSITNAELGELFGKYGELKEIRESPNKKHKFVEFYDVRCAEKAIKALNKSDLHGRKIKIEPSRPGGTNKLETTMARRGSLGSPLTHNAPLYTPSALANGTFTHSTPSLPTMGSPGYMGSPLGTFSSFSPAASGAPLLASHTSNSAYHAHSPSARYYDSPSDEHQALYAGLSSQQPDSGVPSSMLGPSGHQLMTERRNQGLTMESALSGMGEEFVEAQQRVSLQQASLLSNNSLYSEQPATTASLFGTDGPYNASTSAVEGSSSSGSGGSADFNAATSATLEALHGLLLSPASTPRSSVASGSSSSGSSSENTATIGGMGLSGGSYHFGDASSLLVHPNAGMPHSPSSSSSGMNASNAAAMALSTIEQSSAGYSTNQNGMPSMTPSPLNLAIAANNSTLAALVASPGQNQSSTNSSGSGATPTTPTSSSSGHSSSSSLRFDIIIPQVLGGADTRTTLMIKNIPNKYDQEMLLLAVNKHHQGTYDFFYLPIDFKNRCNVGYAFINFIDPKSIPAFYEEFDNKKWEKFNSEKVCRISYARLQGKQAMIEHFKNSSLMFEDPKCRPLIFHSDGSAIGKPEPFPIGPNVRPRSRKDSTGSAPSGSATAAGAAQTQTQTQTQNFNASAAASAHPPPSPTLSSHHAHSTAMSNLNSNAAIPPLGTLALNGATFLSGGAVSPISPPSPSMGNGTSSHLQNPNGTFSQMPMNNNGSINSGSQSPTRAYKPKRERNGSTSSPRIIHEQ